MIKVYIFAICLCVISSITYSDAKNKPKVSIYYETLCPDSTKFFQKILKKAHDKIGSYFTPDFIPYGHAQRHKENGTWKFECQHGEFECKGNKLHACAVNQNYGEANEVKILVCSMSSSNPSSAVILKQCTESLGISFEPIHECFKSKKADELLACYGERTDKVAPSYVPTIIINDVYNQTIQDAAEDDLLKTLCGLLEEKPSACDDS